MSNRNVLALIVGISILGQLGCCCTSQFGCGCGMGGQVYDSCCASCGVADCCGDCASCGCPEASCCCPAPSCGCPDPACGCPEASCCCPEPSCACADPACGCPDSCGGGVGCGTPVRGQCLILQRLRKALRGGCCSSGCCGPAYMSEWSDSPPCNCDPCDCYGNYTGGRYGGPHGQRARMANRNIPGELQLGEAASETVYR